MLAVTNGHKSTGHAFQIISEAWPCNARLAGAPYKWKNSRYDDLDPAEISNHTRVLIDSIKKDNHVLSHACLQEKTHPDVPNPTLNKSLSWRVPGKNRHTDALSIHSAQHIHLDFKRNSYRWDFCCLHGSYQLGSRERGAEWGPPETSWTSASSIFSIVSTYDLSIETKLLNE